MPLTLRRHRVEGSVSRSDQEGGAQGVEGAAGGVEGAVEGAEGAVEGGDLDVVWLNPHCAGAEFLRPFLMSFEPETQPMVSESWLSWFLRFLWLYRVVFFYWSSLNLAMFKSLYKIPYFKKKSRLS